MYIDEQEEFDNYSEVLKHEDFNQMFAITNGGGEGANKQLVSLNFNDIQDYKKVLNNKGLCAPIY